MKKRDVYAATIKRMDHAIEMGFYFEASWLAYAILEDRLVSLLRQTGGVPKQQMLGPKIGELQKRAGHDPLLANSIDHADLQKWVPARNKLMHGMVDGSLSTEEIETQIAAVAIEGARLARYYSAAARRIKVHRYKVAATEG